MANFQKIIESKINCNIPLKTPEHIEQAVATLTATIQEAARTTIYTRINQQTNNNNSARNTLQN